MSHHELAIESSIASDPSFEFKPTKRQQAPIVDDGGDDDE